MANNDLDKGTGVSQGLDRGTGGSAPVNNSQPVDTAPSAGGYGYGGGGGGRGGGYSKPANETPKKNAQLKNQGGMYQKRANDLADNTQGRANELADNAKGRWKDMGKNALTKFGNIDQSMAANNAALTENRRNIQQNIQWQPNQQKQQSTLMALRNRMGNAAYGSSIQDLAEGMQRVDDMNDVELINTWKQNENAAYSNWYQANEALVNDYNDLVADTNEGFSQFEADYADQMSRLKFDFKDELSKMFSQYWAAVSNIDPELATRENLDAAAKNRTPEAKNAKQAIIDARQNYRNIKKGIKSGAKGGKADSVSLKDAKQEVQKAKKAYKKIVKEVSSGEGDEKLTLPNVNLNKTLDIEDSLPALSPALQKALKTRSSADAANPVTSSYVRPDKSDTRMGGTNGIYQTATAANTGFTDNLKPFNKSAQTRNALRQERLSARQASDVAANAADRARIKNLNSRTVNSLNAARLQRLSNNASTAANRLRQQRLSKTPGIDSYVDQYNLSKLTDPRIKDIGAPMTKATVPTEEDWYNSLRKKARLTRL